MVGELIKILSVIGFSATKFMVGVGLTFTYNFSFFGSLATTIGGGLLGVFIFSYISGLVYKKIGANPDAPVNKVRFSRTKRFLVRVRSKFGLAGIAFLTPIFLTVPVGTFLSLSMTKDRREIVFAMFLSFALWSVLFSGAKYIFNINIVHIFQQAIPWI